MLRYKPNPSQVRNFEKKNFTVADGTLEMNMANVIQSFHDSFAGIKCGPENTCACCDQLW